MKKNDLIPQYLQDELNSLVRKKATYTKEEIEQLIYDWKHVQEQLKQLKEAEKYGAISEEEAAITNLTLLVMKYVIEDTRQDVLRFLDEDKEKLERKIKELMQTN